jgi:hypothetical protein
LGFLPIGDHHGSNIWRSGFCCEGIGLTGADEASISGWRIGASATTTDLKIDTGDGPGV